MALYRTGTAAMSAAGKITGTGTKWKQALSLIRTGATIVLLPGGVPKFAVISEIISDTEMNAIATDGGAVANSPYVIFLNDSLTVDGMAQDVAETLRYYQSKETVIQDAIDFFENYDFDKLKVIADQIKANADAAKTSETNAKTSETNAKAYENASNTSKNAAAASATAADASKTAAAGSATTSTQQADRAKTEADRAQSANPDNQLKKAENLNDLANKGTARSNLQVVYQRGNTLGADDNLNSFHGLTSGEYFQTQNVNATTANNYPIGYAGSLKVYKTSAGTTTGCVQEYRVYNGSRVFIRQFDGTNWTKWVEIITSGDPENARLLLQTVYQSGSSLTATDNLNNFDGSAVGEYYNSSNSNATTANNYPTTRAGSLKVYNSTRVSSGIDAGACIQEYRTHNTNQLFLRNKSVGVWSPWVEFSTADNSIFKAPTSLSSENLNYLNGTKIGEYYQGFSASATPANNYPTQIAGGLKVYNTTRGGSGGNLACVQEYRTYVGNRLFMRNLDNTGNWSPWVEFFSSGNGISTDKFIETTGSISGSLLAIGNSNYPALRYNLRYTDGTAIPDTTVGKVTMLETTMLPGGTVSNVNLFRRKGDNSTTDQIAIKLPDTSGTLALQGTSGIEYKHDVKDADYSEAVARIDSLRMVNFVYNDDEQNRVRFGVIAEEAELTAPQYIKHNQEQYEDILNDDGEKVGAKYRDRPSVDNNPIVMDLLGYVKDLRREIDALKAEVSELKSK